MCAERRPRADRPAPGSAAAADGWIGRERVTEDTLTLERARKLAATLDLDPDELRDGGPLPYGWHWIYHRSAARRSSLGEDGHEKRGDFLPPIPLDRRMWAGGRLRYSRPLRIGSAVRRVSTIRSVKEKEGRSGPLAFVTVEHRLDDADGVALEEEQDLVYLRRRPAPERRRAAADADEREGAERAAEHGERNVADPGTGWSESFIADEVTLFRFSALTFNGHRIHYDRRYAVDVEGYPDIVVHGPLLALLLLGAGVRWLNARAEPVRFGYRATQPAFCNETLELAGRSGPAAAEPTSPDVTSSRAAELWVAHPRRGVAMRADLTVGS